MKSITFIAAIIVLISCQPAPKSSGMTSEALATIICQCTQPLVTYNDQLRSLADDDDMGSLTQEMAKGDEVMKTAETCITDKILTSVDPILDDGLNQSIKDQCQLDPRIVVDILRKLKIFNKETFQ